MSRTYRHQSEAGAIVQSGANPQAKQPKRPIGRHVYAAGNSFRCPQCGEWIGESDPVEYQEGQYICEECGESDG